MSNIKTLNASFILNNHDLDHDNLTITAFIKQNCEEIELTFTTKDLSPYLNQPVGHNKRLDFLWKNTCFELFISKTNEEYREYNFDINGNWQCYDFTSYRSGRSVPQVSSPIIKYEIGSAVTIRIKDSLTNPINICAILKDKNDKLDYFSIKNGPDQEPDFHNKKSWLNIKVDGQYS